MLLQRFAVPVLLASVAFFPSVALCQGSGGGMVGSSISFSFDNNGPGLTGLPYRAEMITTRVQTLADGTQITQVTKQVQARDSQGRTRTEIYFPAGERVSGQNGNQPTFVMIQDPVGRQFIHLNSREKTAIVSTFPTLPDLVVTQSHPVQAEHPKTQVSASDSGASLPAQSASPTQPLQRAAGSNTARPTVEKLPGQTIAGVYAEGRRVTRVIPAGREGNNRDITVVTETWSSPELKITVLSKSTDPRSGESTMEIKDLSRDEPGPELFQVPADYKIETPQQSQR